MTQSRTPTPPLDAHLTMALKLIAREAQRIHGKYDPAHDDEHIDGELAQAAAVYALMSTRNMHVRGSARRMTENWTRSDHLQDWPFDEPPNLGTDDTNGQRIVELIYAGNLIISEIARRIRTNERAAD